MTIIRKSTLVGNTDPKCAYLKIKFVVQVPLEVLEQLSANKNVYNVILENYPSLLLCRSVSDKNLNHMMEDAITTRVPVTMSMKLKKAKTPVQKVKQFILLFKSI